jgi:hypothetical protein
MKAFYHSTKAIGETVFTWGNIKKKSSSQEVLDQKS